MRKPFMHFKALCTRVFFLKSTVKLILLLLFCSFDSSSGFLADQKRYKRVRDTFQEKNEQIIKNLKNSGIAEKELNVLLVAYKDEKRLDVFAKNMSENSYKKISTYDICRISGSLGPKRRQGDFQVPEGFYYIDRFNPTSNFHLSLGINYPNLSDRRKTTATDPGDNIFIHGGCASVGCIAMTNDFIKEIYLYSVYARQSGQTRIPVYIFPFEMTGQNKRKFFRKYKNNKETIEFWANLEQGFDLFQQNKKELKFRVNQHGDYVFL